MIGFFLNCFLERLYRRRPQTTVWHDEGGTTSIYTSQGTQGQVTQGQVAHGQVTQGQVTQGQVTEGQVTQAQVTQGQVFL